MKLFLVVIFSLSLIPLTSMAIAGDGGIQNQSGATPGQGVNADIVFVMVQIIQRDNDGNLIGYIESTKPHISNIYRVSPLLDDLARESGSVFLDYDGTTMELIKHPTLLQTDASGLLSTLEFKVIINNHSYRMVSYSHDGMRMLPDEHVSAIWTFLRIAS